MTARSQQSFDDQAAQLVRLLHLLPPHGVTKKALQELLVYAANIPSQFLPQSFPDEIASKFHVDAKVIRDLLFPSQNGHHPVDDFETLVPKTGWLRTYIDYTRETEPPTVFHFFAAACIIGATLERRVYFEKGSGDIFPNLCCVLVAPAGKCKKTTACNLAVNLFRRIGGNVLADKITPEAIIDSFKSMSSATGLIFASEWSVFLGKQQYMEGLVPLLTHLLDCPEIFTAKTMGRGATQLSNVAISHLAASTLDWIQTSITKDAFSGGFMSRLLFIVQHDTPKRFALPPPLDPNTAKTLVDGLLQLQQAKGRVEMTQDARAWYTHWYNNKKAPSALERQLAGYFERKPDRLLQLALVLNFAEDHQRMEIDTPVLWQAERILTWIEKYLPSAFSELASTSTGDDQTRLLKQLRHAKGELSHSEWIRMNRSRINADTFKKLVATLIQSGMVTQDPVTKKYYLLPLGWKED